ncbi:MAG: chromophore lyase CpcT/CpeT [Gammaproteobacteria bacterium]|nr:chromophore lyase CpcT/CpeT [Gammaproteobacteria bacterium]
MTSSTSVFCLCLLLVTTAQADPEPAAFASMLAGRFDSQLLLAADEPSSENRLIARFERVAAADIGEFVFYQQLNDGADLRVYRQRLLVLSIGTSGEIMQSAFSFKEPEHFVAVLDKDYVFPGVKHEDLIEFMPAGCEQIWHPVDGGYTGYVDPVRCIIISSRTGKPRGIEAEAELTSTELRLTERGYDEAGQQIFGSKPGEFNIMPRVVKESR